MEGYRELTADATNVEDNRLKKIPAALQRRNQWVCWRWAKRDKGWTKEPFNARWSNRRARSDDKTTWSSFEEALETYERNPTIDGVGYVFSEDDEYCGIDLDSCISGKDMDPFARQWLSKLGGYQERSVSGTGIHAVVRASLPKDSKHVRQSPGGNVKQAEVYDRNRFFCFTGRVRRDFEEIEDSQEAVDEFLDALFPPKPRKKPRAQVPTNLDDEELLDKARNSSRGRQFMALFDKGDTSAYGYDHSRADYALINALIWWTGGDAERIERLFEQSALYREREKHRGYVSLSVRNALESYEGDFYDEERARRAVERALPPYFNLLLQPMWTERKAVSAYKAYAALLIMATERGVKTDEGIRVGIDIRSLAEICNVGIDTLSENALPWLLKKPHRLIRWRRGKGQKAGYFILLAPGVAPNTIYPRKYINSVRSYAELRQLIRLCYGRSKKRLLGRLGSLSAMVLLPLVISNKQLTLDDLVETTGRKASHLRSVVTKLVGAGLVVEAREDVYRLPVDFWQLLDDELENSGITEVERMRKRRHDSHREHHLVKLLWGRGLSHNTIAMKVGVSVERVREILRPADKVPRGPEKREKTAQKVKIGKRESRDGPADTIESAAEVFAIARQYFPNRDGLPEPLPTKRDPLVHVNTEKVRFYARREE